MSSLGEERVRDTSKIFNRNFSLRLRRCENPDLKWSWHCLKLWNECTPPRSMPFWYAYVAAFGLAIEASWNVKCRAN